MPTARQTARVAPAVVAPSSPCAAHAARSRGPTLRASGVSAKRASSLLLEAHLDDAVDDADRGRHGPRGPDAPLGLCGHRFALAAREPVRDERRLERDHGPARLERGADFRVDADAGRALGHRSQLRHAARRGLDRQLGPAKQEAGGERIACAGRVQDLDVERRQLRLSFRSSHDAAVRAAFTTLSRAASAPRRSASASLANTTSGPSRLQGSPKRPDADLLDGRGGAEVDADRAPRSAAASAVSRSGERTRLYRGHAAIRSRRATPASSSSGAKAVETPRSLSIVRAPSGVAIETTVPVPASTSGPASSTPRPASSSATRRPAGSRGPLADKARAAAERHDPRGDVRGLPSGSDARAAIGVRIFRDRPVEAHDHVQQQVAERADHGRGPYNRPAWTASEASGSGPSSSAAWSAASPAWRPRAG